MRRLLLLLLCLCYPLRAEATSYTCTNNRFDMVGNVTLTGSDTISWVGTATARCLVLLHNFAFSVANGDTLHGTITLDYADVYDGGVGPTGCGASGCATPGTRLLGPGAGGNFAVTDGTISIQHAVFHRSMGFRLFLAGSAGFTFKFNTWDADNLAPAFYNTSASSGCGGSSCDGWLAENGSSTATKFFQGNVVGESWVDLRSPNWVIGDSATTCATPANHNVFIGTRVGLVIGGSGTTAFCNYLHSRFDVSPNQPSANDEENINGVASGARFAFNVVVGGQWMVTGNSGEVDHNVFAEFSGHNYNRIGTRGSGQNGTSHHNIFLGVLPSANGQRYGQALGSTGPVFQVEQTFQLPQAGNSQEWTNNTIDARGHATIAGVSIASGATLTALRNTVWYNLFLNTTNCTGSGTQQTCSAVVGGDFGELANPAPKPARCTTCDYNAFHYASDTGRKRNYAIGTSGTECVGTWGSHDLGACPDGGAASPNFKGPLPIGSGRTNGNGVDDAGFPFSDQDVQTGRYTIKQILDYFSSVYMPNTGSPLLSAASDGGHIGAVQTDPGSALVGVNKAPRVWAGASGWTTAATIYGSDVDHAQLIGLAADDGKGSPDGTLTCQWAKLNGPGTVTFADPGGGTSGNRCATTAAFTVAGVYTFQLTVSDGVLARVATVVVTHP